MDLKQTLLVLCLRNGKPVAKPIEGWSQMGNGGRHLGSKDMKQRRERDYYRL